MKEVIELNQHRLLCGDATNTEDVDLLIGNCKVDLLLTDPPYGINIVNPVGGGQIGGPGGPSIRPFKRESIWQNWRSETSNIQQRNSWNTSQARLPQGERERAVKGKVGKPRHRKTKNVLPNSK